MGGERVLVTGASGYIASHLVQQLQQAGYRVRGTVRSLRNKERNQPILNLCPGAAHPVELVEADLLDESCWPDVVRGCTYVCHTASPFPAAAPKDENEIIRPAVDGTLNVLKACAAVGGVKRVLITSSAIAVFAFDRISKDKVFTEADWADNHTDPYCKSKYLAEKAAWDYVQGLPKEQRFDLVALNPGYVMGPALGPVSTSMLIVKKWVTGEAGTLSKNPYNMVDVRDVARAHVVALKLPEAVGHRHILHTETLWAGQIMAFLKELRKEGYNKMLEEDPGDSDREIPLKFDNSRFLNVLTIKPYPMRETIVDMVRSMIASGHITK